MTDEDTEICGAETTKGGKCQNPKESCPWHNTDNPPENGRDSKLTKERQESIAAQIEQGKSIQSAARMNGITPATVYNWMDRGKDEDNSIYADFFDRLVRAKGFGENKYFNTVWEIAKEEGDHRFLASLMKQRYPDSWGDTDTGVDSDTTVINIPDSVAEKWERAKQ